ncbi:MAG: M3 family oligoendopeptidase [Deinococcaceae bacterium]
MTFDTLTWNHDHFFPSIDSEEFKSAYSDLIDQLKELEQRFDRLSSNSTPSVQDFEDLIERVSSVPRDGDLLAGYLNLFISTNSRNELAQSTMSQLEMEFYLPLSLFFDRWTRWIGSLDLPFFFEHSSLLREHEYQLKKDQQDAQHLMSPQEEELASLLSMGGGEAWQKLYENVRSQLTVEFEDKRLPMAMIGNLARDPNPEIRKKAYEAELNAWKSVEVPIAAALNGIKGETNVLNTKRGYANSIAPSLRNNAMDQAVLDAMHRAVESSLPYFQRYFKAKAKMLGCNTLAWYDLFAPLGKSSTEYQYQEACELVIDCFATFSDSLADFAHNAMENAWIDVFPRDGKRGGAFCMIMPPGKSRILLNHDASLRSVMTLAHELGHAYHNKQMEQRPYGLTITPATLAETASTFCETTLSNALLEKAKTPEERLYILETELQSHAQSIVDIHSRYLFEKAVFEQRLNRELSPQELCNLMLDAQEKTYGDGLDPTFRHAYMWAAKGHYYGANYYNYPYTFGALFSLGLYAFYQNNPEEFKAKYDDFLSRTGMADAADLAAEFGIDIRSEAFWLSSLEIIYKQIELYETFVPQVTVSQ